MSYPSIAKKDVFDWTDLSFQYAFISNRDDEIQFTRMLTTYYEKNYGYTVHDRRDIYGGYNSTLICKLHDEIIGGLSAYINDERINSPVPIEKQGICLTDYMDLGRIRYAEICRAFVLPRFRRYHIYSTLLDKLVTFLARIRCHKSVWIAKKYNTKFYESELNRLGMTSRVLGRVTMNRLTRGENKDNDVEYYLSCCEHIIDPKHSSNIH